jgi:hypothetical protein
VVAWSFSVISLRVSHMRQHSLVVPSRPDSQAFVWSQDTVRVSCKGELGRRPL